VARRSRHPRTAAQFLRQHLPRDAAAKDKENAGQTRTIRYARPSAFGSTGWNRQERFDKVPQRIGEQRDSHSRPEYRPAYGRCPFRRSGGEVLLHVLRTSLRREAWSVDRLLTREVHTAMRFRTRAFRNCIVKSVPTTYLQPENDARPRVAAFSSIPTERTGRDDHE
jgi:hypothetical protein